LTRAGESWRLLVDPAADGSWNMAVDEALLEGYASRPEHRPPTLRLYGWSPPTLSLGRGQPPPDAAGLSYLRREGIGLVRRPSGGGAVLHDAERTYALVGAVGTGPFPAGVVDTYERVARALERALRALGVDARPQRRPPRRQARPPAACFDIASPYELTWQGRKLVGSAQLRRRRGFLQHGSIPLHSEAERVGRVVGGVTHADRHGGLEQALGAPPPAAALDRALVQAFAREFGVRLAPGRLTTEEIELATRLRARRYLSAGWTLHGR